MDYEIVSSPLDKGNEMLILSRKGSGTFIDKLINSKRTQETATIIVRNVNRLAENGIDWGISSGTLKFIDAELALYELRVKGTVIRVMTYIHCGTTPVYLFNFEGHQGKTSKIKSKDLEKAKRLAQIAKECLGGEVND